ncbi:hypothetical protein DPX16_17876 [Anabarilius grahami]|uniref:Uncharacterized protein n=1 Tax=Anabarilius grahami TaxID=495550 RepID=A0A3N0YG95_ANAGA|nr:hypothetical protein DPX16_17876 [Anabarilius grahami]
MDDLVDSISADTSGLPVEDRIHHASMDGLLRNCATGCRVDDVFTMDDLVDSISADTSGLRCGRVMAPVLGTVSFPFLLDLHTEIEKAWKNLYSASIHQHQQVNSLVLMESLFGVPLCCSLFFLCVRSWIEVLLGIVFLLSVPRWIRHGGVTFTDSLHDLPSLDSWRPVEVPAFTTLLLSATCLLTDLLSLFGVPLCCSLFLCVRSWIGVLLGIVFLLSVPRWIHHGGVTLTDSLHDLPLLDSWRPIEVPAFTTLLLSASCLLTDLLCVKLNK